MFKPYNLEIERKRVMMRTLGRKIRWNLRCG